MAVTSTKRHVSGRRQQVVDSRNKIYMVCNAADYLQEELGHLNIDVSNSGGPQTKRHVSGRRQQVVKSRNKIYMVCDAADYLREELGHLNIDISNMVVRKPTQAHRVYKTK